MTSQSGQKITSKITAGWSMDYPGYGYRAELWLDSWKVHTAFTNTRKEAETTINEYTEILKTY